MRITAIIFTFFLFTNLGVAQENTKKSPHFFGIHAGTTTAYGLDFKLNHEMILSTQIGYGFYDLSNSMISTIAGGLSLMYKL